MIPPQAQQHWLPCSSTGPAGVITVGFVGIQGAVITGTHGIGVRVKTPRAAAVAAAVAAATVGFVIVIHIPNGITFTIGIISVIVPTGRPHTKMGILGIIWRQAGDVPKLHLHIAPVTAIAISLRHTFLIHHHKINILPFLSWDNSP